MVWCTCSKLIVCTIVKVSIIAVFIEAACLSLYYSNFMCAWTLDLLITDTLGQGVFSPQEVHVPFGKVKVTGFRLPIVTC